MGATIFGKIHKKNCCCAGACPGCCMPVDEGGNAVDIPFEVDAPGCALDGFTGVFNPLAVAGVSGACGICGTWGYSLTLEVPGQFWNFNGIGCDLVPACQVVWCMLLTCQVEQGVADDPDNSACCRRMRLYVASTYDFSGATPNNGGGACGPGQDYERWIGPDSCACVGGLSAIFSIGFLNPLPQVDPQCGLVQPCVPDCDMTGIRILI